MLRLLLSFFLTVVVARWVYSEIQLSLPQAVPAIDYVLKKVQIPTHDKWDRKKIEYFFSQLRELGSGLQDEPANEQRAQLLRSYYVPNSGSLERF